MNKFDSQQSIAYKDSIQTIINANVKICFIASINDQLVPLFSALASHIFHPNIYRACYIDYTSHTPQFVGKLVSLCTHLLNIGYFDNNVIKELSTSLAGPFSGNGHSKIYNDGKVYDLGIKFVLDTDDIVIPFDGESNLLEEITKSELPISNQIYIKRVQHCQNRYKSIYITMVFAGLLFNIEKIGPIRELVESKTKKQ